MRPARADARAPPAIGSPAGLFPFERSASARQVPWLQHVGGPIAVACDFLAQPRAERCQRFGRRHRRSRCSSVARCPAAWVTERRSHVEQVPASPHAIASDAVVTMLRAARVIERGGSPECRQQIEREARAAIHASRSRVRRENIVCAMSLRFRESVAGRAHDHVPKLNAATKHTAKQSELRRAGLAFDARRSPVAPVTVLDGTALPTTRRSDARSRRARRVSGALQLLRAALAPSECDTGSPDGRIGLARRKCGWRQMRLCNTGARRLRPIVEWFTPNSITLT